MIRLMTAASVLALLAGAAEAQELRIGGQVSGGLTSSDRTRDDYRYDDFRFTARSGQRVEAVLRSDAFDAYLELFREGALEEPVASDDDGLGEGTHARLRYTIPANGAYVLRARTLSGQDGGAYSLSLRERPPAPRPPRPRPLRVGATVDGALDEQDPETDEGGRFDHYSFRAGAGERLAISVTASAEGLDPLIRVGRSSGGFTELASNDDADGLNAYLVFTAPAAGEYLLRVEAVSGEGGYQLKLEPGPAAVPPQDVALGAVIAGTLAEGDGVNDQGRRADRYRFAGQAGQRLRATLTSGAFDTYLSLFREGSTEALAEDDDGVGDGTDSRLTVTLPADGVYVLEARSFESASSGAYELKLEEAAPERAPEPLVFGGKVSGAIDENDPKDDQGRGYDAFTVTGVEGRRMQAIMRSGDFDTYLQVGKAGETFTALAEDDDGLGKGTDSRLNFTFPENGTFVLRALGLTSNEDGLYALELIDRGPEPKPGGLLIGATARGTLTDADATSESGAFYDAYRIEAKRGEKLRFTMVSNAFDAIVRVGREKDGAFEQVVEDDDGLSDTHARLDWEVPNDGAYLIQAGAFNPGGVGEYALTVERRP